MYRLMLLSATKRYCVHILSVLMSGCTFRYGRFLGVPVLLNHVLQVKVKDAIKQAKEHLKLGK